MLASLLIPISVMSVWAIRTVTNTDQYVATMAPLARNQVIVNDLADRATDALFSTKIVQNKVEEVLPKKAKPIVTPIVAEVKTYVHGLALKIFESPKFGQLWDALNRHTHEAVISVLEGKHNATLQKIEQNGQIVLNVSPTLQQLIDKANAKGITIFNPLKAVISHGDNGMSVAIVSTQQVSKYSALFNLLVQLKWWVPIAALVLGILAIVVGVGRRRALLRVTVGVALFTLVLLAVFALGRNIFLNKVAEHSYKQDVAAAVGTRCCATSRPTSAGCCSCPCSWPSWRGCSVRRAGPWRSVPPSPGPVDGWPRRLASSRARPGRPRQGRRAPGGRGLGPRAHQRAAHRRRGRRRGVPPLRRQPHGVEPADHRHRAGGVSRPAPVGRGLGTPGLGRAACPGRSGRELGARPRGSAGAEPALSTRPDDH